eukprot:TRINITY_DN15467_c0_g1_i2.p1 TRINITY_DN15467_c0_g1~~TRINITY_DN15467_c0_g1_i2.p1  ORF type:complete len:363 (+),score=43.24 TRINITY_DN15467_c0_g1_i2:287-1375(+)
MGIRAAECGFPAISDQLLRSALEAMPPYELAQLHHSPFESSEARSYTSFDPHKYLSWTSAAAGNHREAVMRLLAWCAAAATVHAHESSGDYMVAVMMAATRLARLTGLPKGSKPATSGQELHRRTCNRAHVAPTCNALDWPLDEPACYVNVSHGSEIRIEKMGWRGIFEMKLVRGLFSADEAASMKLLAAEGLKPSTVSASLSRKEAPASKQHRTSWSTFVSTKDSPMALALQERAAFAVAWDEVGGTIEPSNVVRYRAGEHYHQHFDFVSVFESSANARVIQAHGNRRTTAVVCLQEPQAGGETVFPLLDISYRLKLGEALIFPNLHSVGAPNFLSLHGSCPILAGSKWVANYWFRTAPQH